VFEIGTGGHAGLLVPAATFRLRQRVGLGVVVEVIRPAIQQQVRTVEAAVLPGCTVLGMQDGFRQGPVAEIVGARETDDRGALLISGGGYAFHAARYSPSTLRASPVPCRFLSRRIELMARLYFV